MFGGTSGLILKYHSITIPSSTSSPIFISPPSQPLFRFHHYPPYTAPKSTSSTSASRHRRHRLTDVDDVDLEGVEQRGKRMCRYRNYTYIAFRYLDIREYEYILANTFSLSASILKFHSFALSDEMIVMVYGADANKGAFNLT